jgi:hypothetical protein
VKQEYNLYAWVLGILVLYFYGIIYGAIILLVTVPLFKNVTHTCPNCDDLLLSIPFHPIQTKNRVILIYIYLITYRLLLVCNMENV